MNKKNLNIIILIIFILIICILSFYLIKYKNTSSTSYSYDYDVSKANEIEKLNDEITSYNTKIDDLNNQLSEYKNSIDSLKEEKDKAIEELEELNTKYNKLSSNNNNSNKNNSSNSSAELKKLENEIEQKKQEIENINNTINEKETTISNLQNEITVKSNMITNLENEIKTLKETFQVVYISDNNIIATYNVKKGNNVSNVPNVPSKTGYDGTWSSDGKNITSNTVISAIYTLKTYHINYNFDYNEFFKLITATTEIEGKNYNIYYSDSKYVIEYLDEYDIELLQNNEVKVIVDSNTYILNLDYNMIFDGNREYLDDLSSIDNKIFYKIEGKTFIYDSNTQKYRVVNAYKIRNDNVFVVDGKSYRIGGEDFKVYFENKSYALNNMHFMLSGSGITINDNKLYDENNEYKFDIVNGKFNYGVDETEYKYAPNCLSIIYKKREGSSAFKNDLTLPTSYTYGDKYFELLSPYRHFNDMPGAHVSGWVASFDVIDNKYILYEDTYGDITIYLYWTPVS